LNWLRPALREFNIIFNRGQSFRPEFIVETECIPFMVEVKGEGKLKGPDVIAKKAASSIAWHSYAGARPTATRNGVICLFLLCKYNHIRHSRSWQRVYRETIGIYAIALRFRLLSNSVSSPSWKNYPDVCAAKKEKLEKTQ